MKRVFIIANLVHASPRIPGLATYFPNNGWKCTILTPSFSKGVLQRIIDSENFFSQTLIVPAPFPGDVFEPLRRLMGRPSAEIHKSVSEILRVRAHGDMLRKIIDRTIYAAHLFFAYPDTETPWIKPALSAARKHLASEQYDAILSTSPFPTNHLIAHRLKKEFCLPWCADFRDPWTQNHMYSFSFVRRFFEQRFERKMLAIANAIITAAPSYSEKQQKFLGREVLTITNGFDSQRYQKYTSKVGSKFSIVYTGTIYPSKQNPLPFFEILRDCIEKKYIDIRNVSVTFYGKNLRWLLREVTKYGISSIVTISDPIPREKILTIQKDAQLLLMFGWDDLQNPGVYPSKLFEYLGAQRPILLIGGSPDEDIKKIVNKTRAGRVAQTKGEMMTALRDLYDEYRKNGYLFYNGDMTIIDKYNYEHLAARYCKLLDKITLPPI